MAHARRPGLTAGQRIAQTYAGHATRWLTMQSILQAVSHDVQNILCFSLNNINKVINKLVSVQSVSNQYEVYDRNVTESWL